MLIKLCFHVHPCCRLQRQLPGLSLSLSDVVQHFARYTIRYPSECGIRPWWGQWAQRRSEIHLIKVKERWRVLQSGWKNGELKVGDKLRPEEYLLIVVASDLGKVSCSSYLDISVNVFAESETKTTSITRTEGIWSSISLCWCLGMFFPQFLLDVWNSLLLSVKKFFIMNIFLTCLVVRRASANCWRSKIFCGICRWGANNFEKIGLSKGWINEMISNHCKRI